MSSPPPGAPADDGRAPGDESAGIPGQLARIGTAIENALLVSLLAALVLLAVGQIVLRLVFSTGFVWADELVRILVLWIALLASVAASRSRRHLRIDLLTRFLPPRLALLPEIVVDAFAAAVCGVIAWHSYRYVALSFEFGDTVLVGTPAWLVQGIVPLCFALMTWRFALHALGHAAALLAGSRRDSAA